jgi:hypothetical protein
MEPTSPRPTSTAYLGGARLLGAAVAVVLAGHSGASAQNSGTPKGFEARLDQVVVDLASDPRFRGLSEPQRRDRVEFVVGNVLFAVMHEVGHMAISELRLPVLGREEDAADAFATVIGLKIGSALSHRILTQSARGWFLSDRRNQKEEIKTVFYDEHGLDQQRAYYIVCIMVGSDPEKFSELAAKTALPPERQASCMGDFSNASWSWNKALEPFIRPDNAPKAEITVTYQDGGKAYELFANGFRQIRLLETVAEYLADRFAWPRPVGLEMRVCNEPAARWEHMERKIIVCYELAAEFAQLYRDYADAPASTASDSRRRGR